jgi:hypothetical protein
LIEIFNRGCTAVDVSGWKINGSNNAGSTSTRATIPASTTIGPGCHYLFTDSAASGGPYSGSVAGNQTYTVGIGDDGGIALLNSLGSIVDQVGMSAGSAYKEGSTLTPLTTNVDRGYERKAGTLPHSQDTDANATDFAVVTPSLPENSTSPCH